MNARNEILFALSEISPKHIRCVTPLLSERPAVTRRSFMKKTAKWTGKIIGTAAAAVIVLGLIFLPGLWQSNTPLQSASPTEDETIHLILLIESEGTSEFCTNHYPEKYVAEYEKDHPSVEIQIEKLPYDVEEREPVLQRIRTEIMAGKGPDIFLLPTCPVGSDYDLDTGNAYLEPLFQNVEQSMYGEKFLDISQYYDADMELDKEGLNQAVMDGGCAGDARYVLPLRYTVPVALADVSALKERKIDVNSLSSSVESFFSTLVAYGDGSISPQFQSTFFCAFPEIYDYKREKVTLEQEKMTSFINVYREYVALSADCPVFPPDNSKDIEVNRETPLVLDNLGEDVLVLTALSRLSGEETGVIPLNTFDGTLTASVTYWCAVGNSCEHPQEAYDFISHFLSPDFQKDQTALGLGSCPGWPVRTNGFVSTLWNSYKEFHKVDLPKEILELALTDEDFSILQAEIGAVRFETVWDRDMDMALRRRLYDWDAMKPTTEDTNTIVQDILDELRWRIQE